MKPSGLVFESYVSAMTSNMRSFLLLRAAAAPRDDSMIDVSAYLSERNYNRNNDDTACKARTNTNTGK